MLDPEAPGRGPGRKGHTYRWYRVDDFPLIGKFRGVVLGTRKGADTLIVECKGDYKVYIRYEHLLGCVRLEKCPSCDRTLLERRAVKDWHCLGCGTDLDYDPTLTEANRP